MSVSPTESTSTAKRDADIARVIRSLPINLRLERALGQGSFGKVFRGQIDGRRVAVKVEDAQNSSSLGREYKVYQFLFSKSSPYVGVPRCLFYYSGKERYRILALPYLGRNLKTLVSEYTPEHRFSMQTTVLIGLQLLSHLEYIHSRGVVHRDVKPANLCIGGNRGIERVPIYLVDFGLARFCVDPKTGKHTKFKRGRGQTGTLRYMSTFSHQSFPAARRDDLQSLAYMLIYFLRGSLPWQKAVDRAEKYSGDRHKKKLHKLRVLKIKQTIATSELCDSRVPECVTHLYEYSSQLEFEAMPDYKPLKQEFAQFLERRFGGINWDSVDWISRPDTTTSENTTTHR